MPRLAARRLTENLVGTLRPPRTGYIEKPCGLVRGLRLRVSASGRRSWLLSYRHHGKQHRVLVGRWPQINLAEARRLAQAARDQGDAFAYLKGETAEGITFANLAAEFLDRGMVARKGARKGEALKSAARYRAIVDKHLVPAWGHKPASELTRLDLTRLTDKITDASGPAAAVQVHRLTIRLFNWAIGRGHLEASPFAGMEQPSESRRRQRVLDRGELRAIWRASFEMEHYRGALYRLLILTGARLSEIARAEWREIDLTAGTLTIRPDRTKNGLAHQVPLSPAALAEIKSLAANRQPGSRFVVSADGKRPLGGFDHAKQEIDRLSGVADWRNHDVRRSVRSGLAELGVAEAVSEKILGHVGSNELVRTYNVHHYSAEKRAALEQWAEHLATIVGPEPEGNVVALSLGAA